MKRFSLFLSGVLICCASTVSAQDFFDEDARFWLYIKINKSLTKKLETEAILQNRFNQNASEFSQANGNLELKYKINKRVKLIAGGVYGMRRRNSGAYFGRYQTYAGFRFRHKIDYFTIVYRNLTQAQWSYMDILRGRGANYYNRNKLTVAYDLHKRWKTYIAGEVNLPVFTYHPTTINRFRAFTGVFYKVNRHSYVQMYFLFQRKFGYDRLPPRDYIYGITYGYDF